MISNPVTYRKIGDDEYLIDDGFNTLISIDSLNDKRDKMPLKDYIKKFFNISLGESQAECILSKNYKTSLYMKIIESISDSFISDSQSQTEEQKNAPTLV